MEPTYYIDGVGADAIPLHIQAGVSAALSEWDTYHRQIDVVKYMKDNKLIYITESNGDLSAFAFINKQPLHNTVFISSVYTLPAYRRQNRMSTLFSKLIQTLNGQRLLLEVYDDNLSAIALYTKLNLIETKHTPVSHGRIVITMSYNSYPSITEPASHTELGQTLEPIAPIELSHTLEPVASTERTT